MRSRGRVSLPKPGRVLLRRGATASSARQRPRSSAPGAPTGRFGQLAVGFVSTVDYSTCHRWCSASAQRILTWRLRCANDRRPTNSALLLGGELDQSVDRSAARRRLGVRPVLRDASDRCPSRHSLAGADARFAIRTRTWPATAFILFPEPWPGLYDLAIPSANVRVFAPRLAQKPYKCRQSGTGRSWTGRRLVRHAWPSLAAPIVRYRPLDPAGAMVERRLSGAPTTRRPRLSPFSRNCLQFAADAAGGIVPGEAIVREIEYALGDRR